MRSPSHGSVYARRVTIGTLAVVLTLLAACGADPEASLGQAPRVLPLPTSSIPARTAVALPTSTTVANDGAEPTHVPLSDLRFSLEPVGTFDGPIDIATRPGDPALYIAQKLGQVVRYLPGGDGDPTVVVDIADRITSQGEQGLLGIAFTPDGSRLVISHTDRDGASTIASYAVDPSGVTSDHQIHFSLAQPYSNHNGGDIAFGPDGFLYLGLGDGGAAGDPLDSGQDTSTMLGAIVRIELVADGYRPAPGNPLTSEGRPELWLWGLRNPWRFSFDRLTGELWIGDVGQNDLEEINVVAPQPSSRNLGWNRYEGTRAFADGILDDHLLPLLDYGHDQGRSVTGGYVYRGDRQPHLRGVYLYGDFAGGWVRALRRDATGAAVDHAEVLSGLGGVASFGEDNDGEIYVISLDGAVGRVIAR